MLSPLYTEHELLIITAAQNLLDSAGDRVHLQAFKDDATYADHLALGTLRERAALARQAVSTFLIGHEVYTTQPEPVEGS